MHLKDIEEKAVQVYGETENDEYKAFKEKFQPKYTTDDCFTPDAVYEAVARYVAEEYGRDKNKFVRPFYPGGDYTKENYPQGCTVVDNPPFSILAEIVKWYNEHNIKYFLFAHEKTVLSLGRYVNCVCVGINIVYNNGADMGTSFVTNMGIYKIQSAPRLYKMIEEAQKAVRGSRRNKYIYPSNVLTFSKLSKLSSAGIEFGVKEHECAFTRGLDSQKPCKKTIYGSGFLISEPKAAELKTAELKAKTEATCWSLSDREQEIIKSLGNS